MGKGARNLTQEFTASRLKWNADAGFSSCLGPPGLAKVREELREGGQVDGVSHRCFLASCWAAMNYNEMKKREKKVITWRRWLLVTEP